MTAEDGVVPAGGRDEGSGRTDQRRAPGHAESDC